MDKTEKAFRDLWDQASMTIVHSSSREILDFGSNGHDLTYIYIPLTPAEAAALGYAQVNPCLRISIPGSEFKRFTAPDLITDAGLCSYQDDDDDTIIGYSCLACGHSGIQPKYGTQCESCRSTALDYLHE